VEISRYSGVSKEKKKITENHVPGWSCYIIYVNEDLILNSDNNLDKYISVECRYRMKRIYGLDSGNASNSGFCNHDGCCLRHGTGFIQAKAANGHRLYSRRDDNWSLYSSFNHLTRDHFCKGSAFPKESFESEAS
jgi:hypothetical protein